MELNVVASPLSAVAADWLIVSLAESAEWPPAVAELDAALGGKLTRLREAGDVTGKAGEVLELRDALPDGPRRVLLVGLGPAARITPAGIHKGLMTAVRRASSRACEHVAVLLPSASLADGLDPAALAESAAVALAVGCVGQGLYRREAERFPFQRGTIVAVEGATDAVRAAAARGLIVAESVNLARELINRHPGELYPETFARRAEQLAQEHSLKCDILDEARLQQERMGSLLAVARGSVRPPRVVVLEHRGGGNDAPLVGLVGKGVTCDSGGRSLKPSDGMKTMKCDMSGAAAVLGAMSAIARLKLPVNVIGLMGLVENMPGGDAYKLGDVLTARNGVTIEVHNTDAEGRLVLADVLSYAVDQGAAKLVDLATLTGSCVVALGEDIAGAFTNDQPWCDAVLAAAKSAGEDVWQMPMCDSFNEQLKSEVADCKNIGTRWGGSITAAKFLQKFVGETPWVHLDIAGPASPRAASPTRKGAAQASWSARSSHSHRVTN